MNITAAEPCTCFSRYELTTQKGTPRGAPCVAEAEGFEPPWGCPQTVFKTLGQLPKSSRIVPKPPQFSAKFSLFLAPSRKFARKLRESCEKPLKTT